MVADGQRPDRYGRVWPAGTEICPSCGQADNCGDCNHQRISDEDFADANEVVRDVNLLHGQRLCPGCDQLTGVKEYDAALWDIYHRIDDGRSSREPLVFTGEWMAENVADEEDHADVMNAMGRDMRGRGLCPECGRPDLRGVPPERILNEEDAEEMQQMWAMEAAERRVGA